MNITKEQLIERLRQGKLNPSNKPKKPKGRRGLILAYCEWCCCGDKGEIKQCPNTTCSLFSVRLRKLSSKAISLKQAIKNKCYDCVGGYSRGELSFRKCQETTCALHGKW